MFKDLMLYNQDRVHQIENMEHITNASNEVDILSIEVLDEGASVF